MRLRIPFFRIFYSTTFTLLSLVLAVLLLVTPGDHIRESFHKSEIFHIFIVAGLYLLTLLVAIFLYAGRLYKTRSALARIPKETDWAGEGRGKVGREIRRGLERSARIAHAGRPRDLRGERAGRGLEEVAGRRSPDSLEELEPVWGTVAHPGWSSPDSPDLPNLQYEPVIAELAPLIEAKAVSLAPSDPLSTYDPDRNLNPEVPEGGEEEQAEETPIPDPVAVDLLQRPASTSLRGYLTHLAALGMLDPSEPSASDFLTRYEHARYSGQALHEGKFRALMGVFADVLRGMRPLDGAIVDEARAEMAAAAAVSSSGSSEGDGGDGERDGDAASVLTTETVRRTSLPEGNPASSSSSSSSVFFSSADASRSGSQRTVHMAPSRPAATSRNPSSRSRRSGVTPSVQRRSLGELRRVGSGASGRIDSGRSSAGSVIRLREARGPLDLPYAIFTGEGEEMVGG